MFFVVSIEIVNLGCTVRSLLHSLCFNTFHFTSKQYKIFIIKLPHLLLTATERKTLIGAYGFQTSSSYLYLFDATTDVGTSQCRCVIIQSIHWPKWWRWYIVLSFYWFFYFLSASIYAVLSKIDTLAKLLTADTVCQHQNISLPNGRMF